MTNRCFTTLLRQELNKSKRKFKLENPNLKTCRYYNMDKAHLESLQNFVRTYQFLSNKDIENFIRKNPTTLRFLNYCLDLIPNLIELLKTYDYTYAFEQVYIAKRLSKEEILNEK